MTTDMDYQGADISGQSFHDMTLDGADFSEADLRGTDFSRASLVGANFSNAKIGVRPLMGSLLIVAALLTSIAAGLITGYFVTAMRERLTSSEWQDQLGGWLLLAIVIAFIVILVRKGVVSALKVFVIVALAAIALDLLILLVFDEIRAERVERGLPVIGLLMVFGPAAVAGILGRVVGGVFGAWAISLVAVLGGLAAGRVNGGLAAIVVSLLLVLIAKRALKNDKRDDVVRRLANRMVSRYGTKFSGADVTRANFTGTLLAQADMSGAILAGAVWDEGKGPVGADDVPADSAGG